MINREYKLFTNEELVDARREAVKVVAAGRPEDNQYTTSNVLRWKRKQFKQTTKLLRKLGREFKIRNLPLEGEPESFTGMPETPFVLMEWAVERHGEWSQHPNKGSCIVYIRRRKPWWSCDYRSGRIESLLSRVRIHRWDSVTTSWVLEEDFAKGKPEHRVSD